jgi:hypothetical protein
VTAYTTKIEHGAWRITLLGLVIIASWWLNDRVNETEFKVETTSARVDNEFVKKDSLDVIVEQLDRIETKIDSR